MLHAHKMTNNLSCLQQVFRHRQVFYMTHDLMKTSFMYKFTK